MLRHVALPLPEETERRGEPNGAICVGAVDRPAECGAQVEVDLQLRHGPLGFRGVEPGRMRSARSRK